MQQHTTCMRVTKPASSECLFSGGSRSRLGTFLRGYTGRLETPQNSSSGPQACLTTLRGCEGSLKILAYTTLTSEPAQNTPRRGAVHELTIARVSGGGGFATLSEFSTDPQISISVNSSGRVCIGTSIAGEFDYNVALQFTTLKNLL